MAEDEKRSRREEARRKFRKRRRSAFQYFQQFSDSTTLHGIRYIAESDRHPIERICWAVAVVVCAVGCGLQIQALLERWRTSPVIVSLAERSTAIWDIPFPALTVCPQNKVRRSKFDIAQARNNSDNSSLSWVTASMVCSKVSSHLAEPNLPHLLHLSQLAPELNDVMSDCDWGWNTELDQLECSELFRSILSDEGVCFTFNLLEDHDLYTEKAYVSDVASQRPNSTWDSDQSYSRSEKIEDSFPRRAAGTGPDAGLKVLLKVRQSDIQSECDGDAQSFKLMVHAASDFPLVSSQFLYVPLDSSVALVVKPNLITTAPGLGKGGHTPPVRGCYFPHEKTLTYFKVYTQENCEIECRNDVIRQFCACQPFYMPIDKRMNMSFCTEEHNSCIGFFSNLLQQFEAEAALDDGMSGGDESYCKCLPSCTEHKYELEVSSSQFDIRNDHRTDVNATEYRYIELEVFYKHMQFIRSHRSELYGMIDFLANCGGLLGLFTGFSVISAIEVIYFASLRLACHVRKRRRDKRNAAQRPASDD